MKVRKFFRFLQLFSILKLRILANTKALFKIILSNLTKSCKHSENFTTYFRLAILSGRKGLFCISLSPPNIPSL